MPMNTSKHVLLIDDDPAITQLLGTRLRTHAGLRISTANTSRLGLQLARAAVPPHLIVCDIDMGQDQMDGGDITYELRRHPQTEHIPVILLSSMITPADMGERSGNAVMVSKMAGTDRIVAVILEQLNR